jgi:hypothetical protein
MWRRDGYGGGRDGKDRRRGFSNVGNNLQLLEAEVGD